MPFSILVESYHEFSQRNGARPLNVAGRLMFATGASCAIDGESRQEPPRDHVENLRCRLNYWRAASRRSTGDFNTAKGECARMAELATRYSNLPGPTNAMLSDLHKLRDAVQFCREEVAKLSAELAEKVGPNPEIQRQRFREQYEREQQARAAAVLGEIAGVNI